MERRLATKFRPLPHNVVVVGAARGLGQASSAYAGQRESDSPLLCRSRPEPVTGLPDNSRVVVVTSLADRTTLAEAFSRADAVLTAIGPTSTSFGSSALLSVNMPTVEASMTVAGVDRIIVINTLLASLPGKPASRAMRLFSWMPGTVGRGAFEQQAVVDALGRGAFSSLRWTLVRAGVNSRGKDERPVASADWEGALNS